MHRTLSSSTRSRGSIVLMGLLGALFSAGLTATSAFISTTPMASSSSSLRHQHLPGSAGLTTSAAATAPKSRRPKGTTMAMVFGGGMGGEGLAELGLMVSSAVGQAHASAMGSGVGTLLLAEETGAPPNIYGEVAMGGFFIIFSGVFSAYIIATMIRNMPIEQFEKLTAELGGGREIENLEAQRIETAKRFKELTQDMAQAPDPTMGVRPDERLADRLSKQTAKALQTDISSIEDEYDD